MFLYRGSHNPFPHTSLPLGSYRATQACLQPDLQHLNGWLPGICYFCALTLPPGSTIELFHLYYLSRCIEHLLRKPNPEDLDATLLDLSSLSGQKLEQIFPRPKTTHCDIQCAKCSYSSSNASYLGGKPDICSSVSDFDPMRQDLVLSLYFLLLATLVLLLAITCYL